MTNDEQLRRQLGEMRRSYGDIGLIEANLPDNPFTLFRQWLAEASANAHIVEPNAMVLSTSDLTSRTVLLKDLTEAGFSFFTNYNSRKAQAIEKDLRVSLLFPWYVMERQVIITGQAKRLSENLSDQYFATRPYGSQIGAWASTQSEVLASRKELENRVEEYKERFPEGSQVPRPSHWGGFVVTPVSVEFWQGRYSRLHDRIRYSNDENSPNKQDVSRWNRIRLNP
ncbi:MAG: pyridoxamine 5'-phosphate oxidase [Actinobacteria bacterium]|nr:pyridoxamine 5'-phosphate oxidase [Actinomycetota bacterium]